MGLKELITKDNDYIFRTDDISELLEIATSSGKKVVCPASFQSHSVDLTSSPSVGAPLTGITQMLFIKESYIKDLGLRAGMTIYVDGTPYSIASCAVELGVWGGSIVTHGGY